MTQNDNIKIEQSSFSFGSFLESLPAPLEAKEDLKHGQIVILPSRIENGSLLFSEDAVPFYKFCTIDKEDDRILITPDDEHQALVLRSLDIFMPDLYVFSGFVIPVLINLVSSYIYDKVKGSDEEPNVKLKIIDGESKTEIDYDGPLSGLSKVEDILKAERKE